MDHVWSRVGHHLFEPDHIPPCGLRGPALTRGHRVNVNVVSEPIHALWLRVATTDSVRNASA